MNEQIKTTTVDQLPEATSLDGLYVFGYASKNAVGKRSVKAPITLLKGNKGDTGAAGKDGKDGEVTLAQLKESLTGSENLANEDSNGLMSKEQVKKINEIENNMKSNSERYKTTINYILGNASVGVSEYICNVQAQAVTAKCLVDYGNMQNYYMLQSGTTTISPILLDSNQKMSLFFDDVSSIYIPTNQNITAFTLSSIDPLLLSVTILSKNITGMDIVAPYLKSITVSGTNAGSISAHLMKSLETATINNNLLAYTIKLDGLNLKYAYLDNNAKVSNIDIARTLPILELLYVHNNPLFTKANLLLLETKWSSRVGKTTGVLKLSKNLYEALSSEERKKFTDKNITFDIVE